MTFSYIITRRLLLGDCKVIYGTFSNDSGSTGGDIETELRTLENFTIQYLNTSVIADAPVVDESLSTAGNKQIVELAAPSGAVTIKTTANTSGFWIAYGV